MVTANATLVSSSFGALKKSKALVLTGAGASVPLGMPAMDGLFNLIDTQHHPLAKDIISATSQGTNDLEFLLGKLTFYETVLQQVSQDRVFHTWAKLDHNRRNLGAQAQELKEHIFERIVRRYGRLSMAGVEVATKIFLPLFLRLLSAAETSPPVLPIFTTNYDLTFEAISLKEPDFRICNGMQPEGMSFHWDPTGYRNRDYSFAIFRMHGCSHWMKEQGTGRIFYQESPDRRGRTYHEPCLLYPVPGKENQIFDEPFRTAYWYFEQALAAASRIIIIGYSGRDPVIQAYLREALQRDSSKRLFIVTKKEPLRPELAEIAKLSEFSTPIYGGVERVAKSISVSEQGEIVLRSGISADITSGNAS
jgi:hypothetical protein